MTALCERFVGSVRWECLDHLLLLGEAHRRRALRASVPSCNEQRPHPGIAQQIPVPGQPSPAESAGAGRVEARPVLGVLHHAYRCVA
jgi:putative transposase